MEWTWRTACPLRARSQWATSMTGWSGLEFLKVPFHVLPNKGWSGARWGLIEGLSAQARVKAAAAQATKMVILFWFTEGFFLWFIMALILHGPVQLYWKNFTFFSPTLARRVPFCRRSRPFFRQTAARTKLGSS